MKNEDIVCINSSPKPLAASMVGGLFWNRNEGEAGCKCSFYDFIYSATHKWLTNESQNDFRVFGSLPKMFYSGLFFTTVIDLSKKKRRRSVTQFTHFPPIWNKLVQFMISICCSSSPFCTVYWGRPNVGAEQRGALRFLKESSFQESISVS